MKAYIACSSRNIEKYIHFYKEIREEVIRTGNIIPADWLGRLIKKREKRRKGNNIYVPDLKEEGIKAISKSDCLIAEVSIPSSSVGYQIGHALSKRVPTLCLYSKVFGEKKVPQVIGVDDTSFLKVEAYSKKDLPKILKDFFSSISSSRLIKFNFIITPEIEKYIDWGAKRYNISKSEFLRQKVIDELIKKDPEFSK